MLAISALNIESLSQQENREVARRIDSVLESWKDTPYLSGSQVKKRGVDCVRFVSGVLDELYGTKTPLPSLPQDASFHVKGRCQSALHDFMKRYAYTTVQDGVLEPGDVVMCGPVGGGPGHALITGTSGLWHCDGRKVVRASTTLATSGVYFFKKAIRGSNRGVWNG